MLASSVSSLFFCTIVAIPSPYDSILYTLMCIVRRCICEIRIEGREDGEWDEAGGRMGGRIEGG